VLLAEPAFAQQPDSAAQALKRLSIEQLMNLEVTSVSKRPERLAQTASAIQVITQGDILVLARRVSRRHCVSPSNLQVAQLDSRQWAISARGFNSTSANKLWSSSTGVRSTHPSSPVCSGMWQQVSLADIDRIGGHQRAGATLWGLTPSTA